MTEWITFLICEIDIIERGGGTSTTTESKEATIFEAVRVIFQKLQLLLYRYCYIN